MPSRPISSLANGFLTLLGVKNMGKNPEVLLDEVRPVLEMRDWYLNSNIQEAVASAAGVATELAGFQGSMVVPAGELWWVDALTVRIDSAPASTPRILQLAAAMRTNGTKYLVGIGADLDQPAGLITGTSFYAPSLRGFFAPGGATLGATAGLISNVVGGVEAYSIRTFARYTPLQI